MTERSKNKYLPREHRALLVRRGVIYGSLTRAFNPQSAAFAQWLVEQTPKDGTIAEVLIAMALDVYNEELEAQDG